jgi:hypothetical protein
LEEKMRIAIDIDGTPGCRKEGCICRHFDRKRLTIIMNPPERPSSASLVAAFPFVLAIFKRLRSLLVGARGLERTWRDLSKRVFQEGETI